MNMFALIAACGSAGVVGWVNPPKPDMTPRVQQGEQLDWRSLEAPLLTNHVQITHRDRFIKAGEAYFDHESPPRWVIFQAVPVPEEGTEPETGYAMYVAKLTRDDHGRITGTEEPVRLSPPGSANTCGWFDPKNPSRVIYGSTILPPSNDQKSGFQVGTRRYVWMFPDEMEIVEQYVFAVGGGAGDRNYVRGPAKKGTEPKVLFSRPNYDAESSFTRDGKFVLYAHVRDEPTRGRPDADIYVYDMEAKTHTPLVVADGYDGGPFFSPDDKWICYRSDRRGDDLLQLFIAELDWQNGKPVGIKREIQITDDSAVNWAPYWHPSGKFLVYGSSAVDPTRHSNYEVFAVEIDPDRPSGGLRQRRVTFGNGADVLPVFSDDGKLMMWTAQRGPMVEGDPKPSSQVWIAEVNSDIASNLERMFLTQYASPKNEEDACGVACTHLAKIGLLGSRTVARCRAFTKDGQWMVFIEFSPATPDAGWLVVVGANGVVLEVKPLK